MSTVDLTDDELNELYTWVDQIPLSRPKKNIARDFSDGLMVAEVVKFFIPKIVSVHNYPASSNVKQKTTNWNTLNSKPKSQKSSRRPRKDTFKHSFNTIKLKSTQKSAPKNSKNQPFSTNQTPK